MVDNIKFCKIRDVKSPERAHSTDAGIDFFIPNDFKATTLKAGEQILIPSGIKVKFPDGYALIAFNKSGIATKKRLASGACIVDSQYTNEVHIHLHNLGNADVELTPGMKIIQFLLMPISSAMPNEISTEEYDLLTAEAERGLGGFGSSGV